MEKAAKIRKPWYKRVWVWIIIVILLTVTITGIVWGSCDAIQKSLIRLTCKDEPSSLPDNYDAIFSSTRLALTENLSGGNLYGTQDVFVPKEEGTEDKSFMEFDLPIVFYFHGGYYVGGGRHNQEPICRMIAAEGYVVVNVDYPLAPENPFPSQLKYVNGVVKYYYDLYSANGQDPKGLFLMGDSAGAHLAANLAALLTSPALAEATAIEPGVSASEVRGVVPYCGFFSATEAHKSKFFMIGSAMRMFFGDRKYLKNPIIKQADIARWIENYPPTLLVCGDKDPFISENKTFEAALKNSGREVDTYFPSSGKNKLGHEFQANFKTAESMVSFERTLAFFAANS